jgi:hypothetical protein
MEQQNSNKATDFDGTQKQLVSKQTRWNRKNRDHRNQKARNDYAIKKGKRIAARVKKLNELSEYRMKNRSKEVGKEIKWEYIDYYARWEMFMGLCFLCGKKVNFFAVRRPYTPFRKNTHWHHILHVQYEGGDHNFNNIAPVHEDCHKEYHKHDGTPEETQRMEFLIEVLEKYCNRIKTLRDLRPSPSLVIYAPRNMARERIRLFRWLRHNLRQLP